ncbi:MAG: isoprenylcysteine carboxylmethyltransferase family protein [Chloroflexota bacterium]
MAWIFITVLGWGFIHSLLASRAVKGKLLGWLGPAWMRFYRLAYNLFAGLSFLPILGLIYYLPDTELYTIPFPWSGIMILGQLGALVALGIGFLQSEPWVFLGFRAEGDLPPELMTGGLYRYVRHPLYTAGLAFIWLMPVMTAHALAINLALTAYIIIGTLFEERKLHHKYGQAYTLYAAKTPMLIPCLRWNKK